MITTSWQRVFGAALFSIAILGVSGEAGAQAGGYPTKPIKMYVGFSPGSATDIVARVVAGKLSERLGLSVVVENKTGAGGSVAAEATARAAPDGYTLLTVSSAIAVNPAVYSRMSFDVERDLTPITLVGALPTVLLINNAVPAQNLQEFLQYARSRPGQLNYGSSGNGGSIHMATELFGNVAGVKMTHVPYRGNAQASAALLGGEINVLVDTAMLAIPSLKSGRVRALAITGKERSSMAPEIPTFTEAGLPSYDATVFFGVMGPANMPKNELDKLSAELNEALKAPDVRARIATSGGIDIVGGSREQFAEYLRSELRKWKRIAQESGVKAD